MSTAERPLLRVVAGGEPTPAELAAVVIAVASRADAAANENLRASRWTDHRAMLRRPLRPGPGTWRHSLR